MVPPPKPRENNFLSEIGVAGRKTGITVKDTGQRDAFGMEPLDGFFSPEISPEKEFANLDGPNSSPAKLISGNQTLTVEESMDMVTSEPPIASTQPRLSRSSLPPRARSPIKTSLNSPARRASSVGYSSPDKRSSPLHAPAQRPLPGAMKLNRLLDFSAIAESPPPLQRGGANGVSESEKGKGPQLEQVLEEETSIVEPTPPQAAAAKKNKKRGLLVQKKAGAEKKAFSLDVESDDESMDESEPLEEEKVREEEEEEGEEGEEGEETEGGQEEGEEMRDAFDEGLSQILDDSDVQGDVEMTEDAENAREEEDEESMPDVIPPKPKAKPGKKKQESAKQMAAAAAKKTKTAPQEKQREENIQPAKANGTEKRSRGKAAKEKVKEKAPEPAPAAKTKSAPKGRGKKPVVQESADDTEVEIEEVEPTPPPPPKSKTAPKGKGRDKAQAVEETLSYEQPGVKPSRKGRYNGRVLVELDSEPTPPPPKVKATAKGKEKSRAKAAKEIEEISESKREAEAENVETAEEDPEEQGQEDEQPAKKRPRTAKEKAPPKLSAKAKGKAPAAPPKEKATKATKATKKTTQETKEPSPELQSFLPSSPPPPVTSRSRTKATKASEASSSKPPPSSQPADKATKKPGQRIVKAPPPSPRAPSEEADGVRRSTRARVEPLAYWKNEKIVYGLGARRKSGRSDDIRLPQVIEIVRVESDSEAEREKKLRRKRSYAASTKAGAKRKRTTKEEEEELEEEDWESRTVDGEVGVVRGYVKSYPPGNTPGEEELEEVELAFSRNRIVTVEVANGDFTFVKTCTEEFFGTGMIEVPPGGIKRTKNSGKMHLVFYMLSGKVEVKVGDNSFRVRKGAQFMVPRGNLYSIENPYDVQAQMFFAQGCEVVAQEDEGEE